MEGETVSTRKKRRRWFWFVGIIGVVAIPWYVGSRWSSVARIQASLQRNYEVDYGKGDFAKLPPGIDGASRHLFEFLDHRGLYLDEMVYRARLAAILGGPIRRIAISYPVEFNEDLGPALALFRRLEHLDIDNDEIAEWQRQKVPPLIEAIAEMKRLEVLRLDGLILTGKDLDRLVAMKGLRTLKIENCLLPPDFFERFEGVSHLESFVLIEIWIDQAEEKWRRWEADPKEAAGFARAHPGMSIQLDKQIFNTREEEPNGRKIP